MTIEDYYRALAPKLTNWLVATGSPYHDACDLVQRTFLKLWEMRDDLRDDSSAVSGLVFTIAKNLRKNAWRDGARMTSVDEIHEDAAGTVQPAASPAPAPRGLHPLPDRRALHPRNRPRDRRFRKPRQGPHPPRQAEAPAPPRRPPRRLAAGGRPLGGDVNIWRDTPSAIC